MKEESVLTKRLEVSRWKTNESSIGKPVELARRNTQLDEIRQEGAWLLAVQ